MHQTRGQIATNPASVGPMISAVFEPYEVPNHTVHDLSARLSSSPKLLSFLMQFHHGLPEPTDSRAALCALTIALSYFVGGFIPLLPYFFVGNNDAFVALRWSIAVMAVALFLFGYVKTCFVIGWEGSIKFRKGMMGGFQMMLVGGIAAGSAMGIVKIFHHFASSSA